MEIEKSCPHIDFVIKALEETQGLLTKTILYINRTEHHDDSIIYNAKRMMEMAISQLSLLHTNKGNAMEKIRKCNSSLRDYSEELEAEIDELKSEIKYIKNEQRTP